MAGILRVAEIGHRPLHRAVADHGAVAVWQALRDGRPAAGLAGELTATTAQRARGYDPADDLRRAAGCGARLVLPTDDEWPAHRLDWGELDPLLQPPPLALYVRGPHRLDEAVQRSVALVGARASTRYGDQVAGDLACSLAGRGWTVVSGGAYGIDVAAHRGALLAEVAPTVAVLGCGVDVAYPRGNDRVLARIAEVGLVVAEAAPGSHPLRRRFLVRNRLIAALSVGTVVVEAATRSGSLATAERARILNRHVMAVPGSVFSSMSAGCHQQLRVGAVCVASADEVLALVAPAGSELAAPVRGPDTVRDRLPATVQRVLDAVPVRGSAGVGALARDAGVPVLVVQQVLPPLQAHGLVERTDGGWRLTALGAGRPVSR